MREIKFRAWNNKNNVMFQVHNLSSRFSDEDELGFLIFPLMQYTGLKDKNGKEIYEGDILKITCACGHYENLPVRSKDGHNGYYAKARWQHNWDNNQLELHWTERDTEVVGNIYENSGLITPLQ